MPVIITVDPSLTGTIRRSDLDRQAEMVAKATTGRSRPRRPLQPVGLRYKLKDFVVGQSNKLAYSAALAVTGQAQAPFGHLFVHGPCGVGKTHLLQAICNELPSMRRGGKPVACRYVTAEQFTNEFISALRAKRVDKFRALYRKLGLLAIDDVHFLAAKKATQDEFLHTFNAIESAGNQIVMASDARPRLVGQLNPQLVSRFVAGMVVRIDLPDRAVRMEILRRRARKLKLKVATEVLEYVAMQIRSRVGRRAHKTGCTCRTGWRQHFTVNRNCGACRSSGPNRQCDHSWGYRGGRGDFFWGYARGHPFNAAHQDGLCRTNGGDVPCPPAYTDELPRDRAIHGQESFLGGPCNPANGKAAGQQGRVDMDDPHGAEVRGG